MRPNREHVAAWTSDRSSARCRDFEEALELKIAEKRLLLSIACDLEEIAKLQSEIRALRSQLAKERGQ